MDAKSQDIKYRNVKQKNAGVIYARTKPMKQKWCKRKQASDATKTVKDSGNIDEDSKQDKNHSFIFKVGVDIHNVECVNGLLVDCGATTHIVHDINKFIRFDEHFNPKHHYIELADGSRSNNVALKRGDVSVELRDVDGNVQTALLKNALYVPSYKQDIFSVQAATNRGATVSFSPNHAKLVSEDGTKFKILKRGKLYYLNLAVSSSMSKKQGECKSLKDWHDILGHCNFEDALALEKVVEGMKITDKKE